MCSVAKSACSFDASALCGTTVVLPTSRGWFGGNNLALHIACIMVGCAVGDSPLLHALWQLVCSGLIASVHGPLVAPMGCAGVFSHCLPSAQVRG